MKKVSLCFVVVLSILVMAKPAKAGILELRGGVGLNSANPDGFENEVKNVSGKDLNSGSFDNYNVDLFVNIPVLPIGVGIRKEWLSNEESSSGQDWKIDSTNISLLVDWRIIDTGIYVGPILGVGVPSANVDFHSSGTGTSHHIDKDQLSYFGGAEAGVKLGRFIIGAEAGYTSIKLKEFQTSGSTKSKIDLSGFYGKAMVGIALF